VIQADIVCVPRPQRFKEEVGKAEGRTGGEGREEGKEEERLYQTSRGNGGECKAHQHSPAGAAGVAAVHAAAVAPATAADPAATAAAAAAACDTSRQSRVFSVTSIHRQSSAAHKDAIDLGSGSMGGRREGRPGGYGGYSGTSDSRVPILAPGPGQMGMTAWLGLEA